MATCRLQGQLCVSFYVFTQSNSGCRRWPRATGHHIITMTGWTIHVPASARGSARPRGVSHRRPPPAGPRVRSDRWPRRIGEGRSALCLHIAGCIPARVMRHNAPQDQNGENLCITGGVLKSRSFLWTRHPSQVLEPGLCVAM